LTSVRRRPDQAAAPEFFSLTVFGFVVVSNVTGGSLVKALMMAMVGLILGTIGLDPVTGSHRFTFGTVSLLGIEFVAGAFGLFGIAEVLSNVAPTSSSSARWLSPTPRPAPGSRWRCARWAWRSSEGRAVGLCARDGDAVAAPVQTPPRRDGRRP
jgi:putative tricarboxylic transport membrane protein